MAMLQAESKSPPHELASVPAQFVETLDLLLAKHFAALKELRLPTGPWFLWHLAYEARSALPKLDVPIGPRFLWHLASGVRRLLGAARWRLP